MEISRTGPRELAVSRLTDEERSTYLSWLETKNKPSISPVLAAQMFELFLSGATCDEIAKVNSGMFVAGQILEARVAHGWDDKRDKYLADLYGGVLEKVKKTQVEAVGFTSDLLAAAHKQYGTKLRKYIQSGNEKDLEGSIQLGSLQTYVKAVETLMKLTGQDKKEKGAGPVVVMAGGGTAGAQDSEQSAVIDMGQGGTEKLDSGLAFKVLQFLEKEDE